MRTNEGDCFGCGRSADAMWQGSHDSVHVCRTCAVEVLPALIADAVFVPAGPVGTLAFDTQLSAVHAAYWRAVAARVAHEARTKAAK